MDFFAAGELAFEMEWNDWLLSFCAVLVTLLEYRNSSPDPASQGLIVDDCNHCNCYVD